MLQLPIPDQLLLFGWNMPAAILVIADIILAFSVVVTVGAFLGNFLALLNRSMSRVNRNTKDRLLRYGSYGSAAAGTQLASNLASMFPIWEGFHGSGHSIDNLGSAFGQAIQTGLYFALLLWLLDILHASTIYPLRRSSTALVKSGHLGTRRPPLSTRSGMVPPPPPAPVPPKE